MSDQYEAVVIGVSAGGLKALRLLLGALPADFPAPVIIVQHRMATVDNYLVTYLDSCSPLKVREAEDKEPITAGRVYIAPADYHLLVEKDRTFSLSLDELVSFSRPSIDVLFETAADVYRQGLIGIILTGANADGSMGIQKIKAMGGVTIAQHPDSAEVKIMPLAAIATKAVDFILTLPDMPSFITNLLEGNHDSGA